MPGERLMIGTVAEQTGCKVETIRFYEKEKMLPQPKRSEGGHRLYTIELIDRLKFIRRCRELGFTLNEIRELLSLVDSKEVSCARVKTIADLRLEDVRRKISDLRKMERTLRTLSEQCAGGDTPECPIVESLKLQ